MRQQTIMTLTSDWLPGFGSCGPSAPPPPAWSAPPPAAAASPAGAAACWPGWSPAAGPPSRAAAAWSPGRGPPLPAPTSSHCPAVLAGAVYSAPWQRSSESHTKTARVSPFSKMYPWYVAPACCWQITDTADKFIASGGLVQAVFIWLRAFVYINFAESQMCLAPRLKYKHRVRMPWSREKENSSCFTHTLLCKLKITRG